MRIARELPGPLLALRREVGTLVARRDETTANAAALAARIASLRRTAKTQAAAGNREAAAAAEQQAQDANQERDRLVAGIRRIDDDLHRIIGGLAGDDLVAEGDLPVALLPLRIETRSTANLLALRVRIYPDDLHVESLDRGVSEDERKAGETYWTAAWAAPDAAAWPAFVASVGPSRAEWVAAALTPSNLDARPGVPPEFPKTALPAKPASFVSTLPDRFHVFVEQAGLRVEVTGSAIPDRLAVALPGSDFTPMADGSPPVDDAMRWMVDFDTAVSVGMAVTVPLPRPGFPIDRVVVIGFRATLDPAASSGRFADLLVSHQYARGAAFVPQGTPTNNTESDRAGWTSAISPSEPPAAPVALSPDSNAAVLAAALGVPPATLSTLDHAAEVEQREARAMNTALWSATWGEMFERLLIPSAGGALVSDFEREVVRSHFIASVRGRGPIPALRVDDQPYGFLPVTAIDDDSFRALAGGVVETRLAPFLSRLRAIWQLGLANVSTVMSGDVDKKLPDILGSDALMLGLRVRSVLSANKSFGRVPPFFETDPNLAAQALANQLAMSLAEIEATKVNDNGILGAATRVLALPLVDPTDKDFIAVLIKNGNAPAPVSVLQVLLGYAAALERNETDAVATPGELSHLHDVALRSEAGVDKDLISRATNQILQGNPDPETVRRARDTIAASVGLLDRNALAARQPVAGFAAATAFAALTDSGRDTSVLSRDETALKVIGSVFGSHVHLQEFLDALQVLHDAQSDDVRELLLKETLDLCSHRLDAWVTSIASARLDRLRLQQTGTVLGAYGWVEGIQLTPAAPVAAPPGVEGPVFQNPLDGGHIHAPSLVHAATAGILRSGRLSHRAADANAGALTIDLSSRRVREALSVVEGVRQGQPLGAMLGYHLERSLHEQSHAGLELDRFIYVLRALAPLVAGKLTDPDATAESVAAANVVDGVRLGALAWPAIQTALNVGPAANPYITTWDAPTPTELAGVQDAIAAMNRLHDAVADLLLAEGVHQLAKGGMARAGAALNSIAAGDSVPPIPDVVRTPRSGIAFTHRVALVVPDPLPPAPQGWNRATPRAAAEPRLEAWAEAQFGEASGIPLDADALKRPIHTLAEAHVSALDLLYDADSETPSGSSLVWKLRRAIPSLGDDLSLFLPAWNLARTLRAAVLSARPATPALFDRKYDPAWNQRALDARDALGAAIAALPDGTPPETILDTLAPFGVRVGTQLSAASGLDLAPVAAAALAEAKQRIARADELTKAIKPADTDAFLRVLTAVFGDSFAALPTVGPPATPDDALLGALGPGGAQARDGQDLRPWLDRAASVRPATGRYSDTLTAREAAGGRVRLRLAQTPAGGAPRWVGLPFPQGEPISDVPVTAMVYEPGFGVALSPDDSFGALVFDEWIDVVPRRVTRNKPDAGNQEQEGVLLSPTGIAINANGPNARAPQVVLLALSPDGQNWTKDKIYHVVRDTLELMRERAVTLERVPWAGRILPALYFRSWSLQGEPVIDFSRLRQYENVSAVLRYTAEGK